MQEKINQLQQQILDLQKQIEDLSMSQNTPLKGVLDDQQVERVFFADLVNGTAPTPGTTGPYSDNTVLYQVGLTGLAQDIKILNFPTKFMVYTWKGQRLAIPVYEISSLILP